MDEWWIFGEYMRQLDWILISLQRIGLSLDEDSVIETMGFFHKLQSHRIVRQEQMDDDCERGMYRACHILAALMDYEASVFKDMGKWVS